MDGWMDGRMDGRVGLTLLPISPPLSLCPYLSLSLSPSLFRNHFGSRHFGSSPKPFWLGCGRVIQAHSFLWVPGGYGIQGGPG